jgi:hypothetical protein
MKRLGLLVLFACVLTLPPLMTVAAATPGDGPFVVIHPPWVDGDAAVRAAGGRPIGPSDTGMTTLAAAADPAAFLARMRGAGHGLVVATDRLPFLCTGLEDPQQAPPQRPVPQEMRTAPRS